MDNLNPEIKDPSSSPTQTDDVFFGHFKKTWTVIIIVIIIFAFGLYYFFGNDFLNRQNSAINPVQTISNATLDELLSKATLHFGPIPSDKKDLDPRNLSLEVGLFLNKNGDNAKASLFYYSSSSVGFYGSYTAKGTSAEQVYQTDLANAKAKQWSVLYGTSSSKAAVLEAAKQVGGQTNYKVQVTYQNLQNGDVAVVAQYILLAAKK